MATMKAGVVLRQGGPEAISIEQVPRPEPRAGEALVRVRACGMNRMDIWARSGPPGPIFPWKAVEYPVITGGDIAGDVVEMNGASTTVAVGDRVVVYGGHSCGTCEFCLRGEPSMCARYSILGEHTQGGFAEYVVVPIPNLQKISERIDVAQAAAIPVGFTTAWRLLMTAGEVRAGDDVLVLAAGGSVGVAAMQIARAAGARVFAGASTAEKRRQAIDAGAVAALDPATDFSAGVLERTNGRGVDIVVDSLGATWPESIRSLVSGGRLVCCGATLGNRPSFDIRELYQKHRSIRGAPMGNRSEFNQVVRLVEQGSLTPIIDSVFSLDNLADAHRRVESRDSFGKVVVSA